MKNSQIITTLIAKKSGLVEMGGYLREKTAQIVLQKIDGIETWYRVSYVTDSTDECFKNLDNAMDRYTKISSIIK